ncbi:DUF6056 family protein [Gluconacetobacter entanii]|uniref:DUF6056 family protein n=1 Tax=Gluconacetobacter entanii TaxID=108528 RepID=UPI001C936177|nr:DUF6056 family protein [Gluconacetobacter entanii]MBY4640998.1 DUF6056 family protein [Gluconacetobacter entanii]MCW4581004.1 DUF6056 family protein [Gluconacetobacter entanii]MCW4584327.1 DUF6056 family protein [Gluconacetobacter entanii]MCW4587741.1 DUF6056 family protein [Gluconacetobacter entanii]
MKNTDLVRFMTADRAKLCALGMIFLFSLWANIVTPLWADDYCRTIPVDLKNTFHIVYGNYFYWTGRYFTTLITFLVLEFHSYGSIFIFDVLNALVFCVLVHNVCMICRDTADPDRDTTAGFADIIFVFLAIWWIPRDISEVALWKTGAIGYLWPVTGELWILRQVLARRLPSGVLACGFAFFIATFLEPLSLLMSMVLIAFGISRHRDGRPVACPFIGFHLLGTLFLWLAPGNYVRARTMEHDTIVNRLDGVLGNVGSLFDLYWIPFVIILLLCHVAVVKDGGQWSRSWKKIGTFAALSLIYMMILLLFPRSSLAARVSFPASIYLVCILATLFINRPTPAGVRNRMLGAGIAGLAIWHMWVCVPDLLALAHVSAMWNRQTAAHSAGFEDVTLPRVTMGPRHKLLYVHKDILFVGISPDPHNMMNVCFARALGVKSVHSTPE